MRGCRISIMLENTTGNSASMPLMVGPTQPDSVTTVATKVATSDARSGMSYQRRVISGILTWRNRASNGIQIPNAIAFTASPPISDQWIICTTTASAIQTAAAHAQLNNALWRLSLIHISEPTRQAEISYAVF